LGSLCAPQTLAGIKRSLRGREEKRKGWGNEGERDWERGEDEGMREGREREGMEHRLGKLMEGMGGTGQDMGGGGRERRKVIEREVR